MDTEAVLESFKLIFIHLKGGRIGNRHLEKLADGLALPTSLVRAKSHVREMVNIDPYPFFIEQVDSVCIHNRISVV